MGCKEFSKYYLNILNGILLAFSFVVLVYSAYLTSQLQDFNEAIDEGAIITPLVFAAFMFVVSVVGICAVRQQSKILLLVYLVAATIITFAVLVSGAVLLTFSGVLDNAEDERVGEATGSVEARVVDFGLAVYQTCCVEDPVFGQGIALPADCDDMGNLTSCISDRERFQDFADNVPESLCEFLEDVDVNGNPIVGSAADNGCAGGDPAVFVGQVLDFINDNIQPLGIANVVIGVLMILDLIMTCVLLWSKKDEYGYGKKAEANGDFNEQAGPEVAQGTEVKY